MNYISKDSILRAYQILSRLSEDPKLQGATQKVSAIRYCIALDAFCQKTDRGECNTRDRDDKALFEESVGEVCGVSEGLYSANFYYPLKTHNGDYSVGSNFFSVGQVKVSLASPNKRLNYPQRGGVPLFHIQNGVLHRDTSLYENLSKYIETDRCKIAFAIWLLRTQDCGIEANAYDHLKNTLKHHLSEDLVNILLPETDSIKNEAEALIGDLSDAVAQLTDEDIKRLFENHKTLNGKQSSPIPLQAIYYGAPGTGKSYKIKRLEKGKATKPIRTTFHPDSDYATFVGAYKPTMIDGNDGRPNRTYSVDELAELLKVAYKSSERKSVGVDSFVLTYAEQIKGKYGEVSIKELVDKSGLPDGYQAMVNDALNLYHYYIKQQQPRETKIAYNYVPQAFLKAYVQAWRNYPEPQYLVIEEINRGNCAQIFGDLFQLLDRSASGFSEYPIAADSDISKYLLEVFSKEDKFALTEEQRNEINALYKGEYADVVADVQSGELLLLPKNLHILATMNTSDQSLFPIDSAFKRRWEWEYVPICNANKGWVIAVDGEEWDWWSFLKAINAKIGSVTDSEDKKLGYFFVKPSDNHTITAETFVSKVIFYLWNDVFKDYGFSDEEFQTKDGKGMSFPMFYETENEDQRVNEALIAQFLQNVVGNATEGIQEGETAIDEA